MQFRVAGITATQADTASVDLDDMSAYNVRGSKQKSGAANVVLAIKEIGEDGGDDGYTEEYITWKVMILKNRDGAKFYFYARFHKSSGTVREFDREKASPEEREEVERDIKYSKSTSRKRGKRGVKNEGEKEVFDVKKEGLPRTEKEDKENDEHITSIAQELDDISEEELNTEKMFGKKPSSQIKRCPPAKK
jgi:hypothetical protein